MTRTTQVVKISTAALLALVLAAPAAARADKAPSPRDKKESKDAGKKDPAGKDAPKDAGKKDAAKKDAPPPSGW